LIAIFDIKEMLGWSNVGLIKSDICSIEAGKHKPIGIEADSINRLKVRLQRPWWLVAGSHMSSAQFNYSSCTAAAHGHLKGELRRRVERVIQ